MGNKIRYENNTYKNYELGSLPKDSIKELEELSRISATEEIVMLENKNDILPLKKGDRVSVFGRIQREYYKSGTGSGGLVNVKYVTNVLDSLRACEGIEVNEELASVYEEWIKDHPFITVRDEDGSLGVSRRWRLISPQSKRQRNLAIRL